MKELVSAHIQIEKNRYRETNGLYFEDFVVGDIFEHRPGRTVTEIDNVWQSLINMNQCPLHIDDNYSQRTEFKKPLVSSLVTFCIINGMTVTTMSAKVIANLGWDKVRLTNPVFVGDTLYAESEILEVRESKSRPTQGIVKIKTIGIKQDGTIVMTCERTFLVPKKGNAVSYSVFESTDTIVSR